MKSEHYVAICRQLVKNPHITQRELATKGKLSLGLINSVIKESLFAGYLKKEEGRRLVLTKSGRAYLEQFRVKNAIILAAGFGSRCIPLTYETPKGLLEIHGQPMIERQIQQLLEENISDITIVVGYKKEQFDYLIDKYGVKLVFNPEYAVKNNLSSLYRVLSKLDSTYLLMSDHWIEESIFNAYEARSWSSCTYFYGQTNEWCIRASQSGKIKSINIGGLNAWALLGPAYFSENFSAKFSQYIDKYYNMPGTADFYWEDVLMRELDSLSIYKNRQTGNVFEIENLEELRLFDPSYDEASKNKVLETISKVFGVPENEILDIVPIKMGMTNRSFTFSHGDSRYIMRIPGEGTGELIDRENEAAVYELVAPLGLCDPLVYIDPKEGYKITKLIEDVRVCDPLDTDDVKACMNMLREFHRKKLSVPHVFDPFERIEFYESLWGDNISCFRDYEATKENIFKLKEYIDSMDKEWTLTHIDAVSDNFLFVSDGDTEQIRLIDWEYSSMQDPHVDIAMFAIYAMYDREHVDALIDSYFEGGCPDDVRLKIYAYIAVCGLLWSNWCEFKSHLGVEFGEYALRQYRFAKDYYRIFNEMS